MKKRIVLNWTQLSRKPIVGIILRFLLLLLLCAMATCDQGHPLVARQVRDTGRSCDVCEHALPLGTSIQSCRQCDFDMCPACFAGDASAASTSASGQKCPKNHDLLSRPISGKGHSCDECERSLPKGTMVMMCPRCEYELCSACASKGSAPAAPAASEPSSNGSSAPATSASFRSVLLDIKPRKMWGWGPNMHGYCGETSIQNSGLFFGQYVSQERVRYAGGNEEILVDVNAHTAAEALQLSIDRWDCEGAPKPQAANFQAWARQHIDAGHPVIFGVYQTKKNGDDEYDHIVLATGYDTDNDGKFLNLRYNDLFLNEHLRLEMVRTRAECNQRGPVSNRGAYAFEYSLPKSFVSAMAVTGIQGMHVGAPRVQLDVGRWDEPDWGEEDGKNETPIDLKPVVTVQNLIAGQPYVLLSIPLDGSTAYSSPTQLLAARAWTNRFDFVPQESTHVIRDLPLIRSDSAIAYRCVSLQMMESAGGDAQGCIVA